MGAPLNETEPCKCHQGHHYCRNQERFYEIGYPESRGHGVKSVFIFYLKGMVKAERYRQEFGATGQKQKEQPSRKDKRQVQWCNPWIIDIQQPTEEEQHRNNITEYWRDKAETGFFCFVVNCFFQQRFVYLSLKFRRDSCAKLSHVTKIEILNPVFKGFFENVKAKDESKVRVQDKTSFWSIWIDKLKF